MLFRSKEDFESYMGKNYIVDQCGVTPNGKPIVWLACPNKGDGLCVDYDSLDADAVQIDSHRISADAGFAKECE